MIDAELFREEGILTVFPTGAWPSAISLHWPGWSIRSSRRTAGSTDSWSCAERFPGWDSFAALTTHIRFVRSHESRIRRVAVVTDSPLLELLPALAQHFVKAEVRRFSFEQRDAAFDWLKAP